MAKGKKHHNKEPIERLKRPDIISRKTTQINEH